jgi:hypothetical protein
VTNDYDIVLCSNCGEPVEDIPDLLNALQAEQAKNERLRAALRKVEPYAFKLRAAGQAATGWRSVRECRECGATFVQVGKEPAVGEHGEGCVFKISESATVPLIPPWLNSGLGTCKHCGDLFKLIDGEWVGNHRDVCPMREEEK